MSETKAQRAARYNRMLASTYPIPKEKGNHGVSFTEMVDAVQAGAPKADEANRPMFYDLTLELQAQSPAVG